MSHTRVRKLKARLWLTLIFLILSGAHYCFYRYSIDPLNSVAVMRGVTFGCVLWTSVLLGVVWFRQAWARYLLIALVCLAIIGFGVSALVLGNESSQPLPNLMHLVIGGLILYAVALVPLGISRSLQRYVAPREAGD